MTKILLNKYELNQMNLTTHLPILIFMILILESIIYLQSYELFNMNKQKCKSVLNTLLHSGTSRLP